MDKPKAYQCQSISQIQETRSKVTIRSIRTEFTKEGIHDHYEWLKQWGQMSGGFQMLIRIKTARSMRRRAIQCGHPNRGFICIFAAHTDNMGAPHYFQFHHLCIHIAWMLPPSASVDAYLETYEGNLRFDSSGLNVDQIIKSLATWWQARHAYSSVQRAIHLKVDFVELRSSFIVQL